MPTLSSVAELIMGQSPPSDTYNDRCEGLPFYQGKTDFGFKHPTPRLYCSSPKKIAEAGDILISVRAPVGPTNIVAEKSCIGRGLGAIRAQNIHSEFLYFNLKYIEPHIASLGTGSTFTAINKNQLANLEVNQIGFDIPEQCHIARVLTTVQNAIEQQARLIDLTSELKSTLMNKLFTEGLRGEKQKETEIGLVPESWEGITLGELANPNGLIQTGPFGSQLHKSDYQDTGIPVVNPTHMLGNKINHENLPKISAETANKLGKHILKTGDIVFGRRGEIGRHGLVTKDEDGWFCGTGSFLVRVNKDHIDNRFLSYYFSLPQIVTWLNSHAAGVIMPNLNNTVLGIMSVFHPKYEDQVEIANALDRLEDKTELHKKKRQLLEELFRALLHQLMTGQIRVKDLEI